MKQNRKEFTLLAASGCFSFRLFLCGRGPRCLAPVPGTRNKDFPSFLPHFFFLLCCVFVLAGLDAGRRRSQHLQPSGRGPQTPAGGKHANALHKTVFDCLHSRPGASSGKPGRGSNNPVMFCSLASSLTAKYFRRRSLLFPAHRKQKHPPEANSHPVFVPQTLFCSREIPSYPLGLLSFLEADEG